MHWHIQLGLKSDFLAKILLFFFSCCRLSNSAFLPCIQLEKRYVQSTTISATFQKKGVASVIIQTILIVLFKVTINLCMSSGWCMNSKDSSKRLQLACERSKTTLCRIICRHFINGNYMLMICCLALTEFTLNAWKIVNVALPGSWSSLKTHLYFTWQQLYSFGDLTFSFCLG